MLVTCWSVKGGVGTSVVAASLAVLLSRRHPGGALLVDGDGDQPAIVGRPPSGAPGLAELTRTVTADATSPGPVALGDRLERLATPVDDLLALVPRGDGPVAATALAAVADALLLGARPTVVDAGRVRSGDDARLPLLERATTSLLVVRPCYLALRRALDCGIAPTGVVVVDEPDRSLDAVDVQDVLGAPVLGSLPLDRSVASAVDAGVLVRRLPRSLARGLAAVA